MHSRSQLSFLAPQTFYPATNPPFLKECWPKMFMFTRLCLPLSNCCDGLPSRQCRQTCTRACLVIEMVRAKEVWRHGQAKQKWAPESMNLQRPALLGSPARCRLCSGIVKTHQHKQIQGLSQDWVDGKHLLCIILGHSDSFLMRKKST